MLHQSLFCVLAGNSTEIGRGNFHFKLLPHLGIRFYPSSIKNRDLIVFADYFIGNEKLCEGFNIPSLGIDRYPELTGWADSFFRGRKQRFLNRRQQGVAVDSFLPFPIL